jgi:hypothetical protein
MKPDLHNAMSWYAEHKEGSGPVFSSLQYLEKHITTIQMDLPRSERINLQNHFIY